MIGMQYKVKLPSDYDMANIRDRVKNNGNKTDGFEGLHFKAYLISEKGKRGNHYNSYSPLYVWDDSESMNKFLFEGFYDNILDSFGWQTVNIGIPLQIDLTFSFSVSKYVVERMGTIEEKSSLRNFKPSLNNLVIKENPTSKVTIYNPDKWSYSTFYFFEEYPKGFENNNNVSIYEILHISRGR
ncbi:DUF4865 family protein [Niallia sp. 03133]|uniref:DUF4865 family protein n=1 Tax=Niallia sp. 03133 TaxID=3458060 RepID=UPI004044017F